MFTHPKENSKGKSSLEFWIRLKTFCCTTAVDWVDQTDLAKRFDEVFAEYKDLATKAKARCKFGGSIPESTSTSSVIE